MRYLVTGKEMSALDRQTSEHFHVPPVVLMEQAAMAFVTKLLTLCGDALGNAQGTGAQVLVVCGTGNNGGDGLAIARLLNQRGIRTAVWLPKPVDADDSRVSELFALQWSIYRTYGYPYLTALSEGEEYEVVIDAIFGTGLSREVTGVYADAIRAVNVMHGKKLSVDIPSGVCAEDGRVLGCAVYAGHTITFSYEKLGMYLYPGAEYCGCVHLAQIGITPESWLEKKPHTAVLERSDLKEWLPERPARSHKGSFGRLLVIAGSRGMAGAAIFCAGAANRSGCGLVKVITPEENRLILQTRLPEAVLSTYGEQPDEARIRAELAWADAVVIGPGLGTGEAAKRLLSLTLSGTKAPTLLDADALNLLAADRPRLEQLHADCVLTPHLKEMSRLTGEETERIAAGILETAAAFAEQYEAVCVLKDAHTVTAVPYGSCYLNLSGNDGLATGGTGDVLAGIIGGLLAQRVPPAEAAPLGVFLHGLAADAMRNLTGTRGMTAPDVIEGLGLVWTTDARDA